MESGGDIRPRGDLTTRRTNSSALQAAIDAESNTVSFARAWLTAVQQPDGSVTTTAHATANYSHRGEPRECHVSFEVENDGALEEAFKALLDANAGELVKQALKSARMCEVAADHNTDVIGGQE